MPSHRRTRIAGCLLLAATALGAAACSDPAPLAAQGPVSPPGQESRLSFDESTALPAGAQPFSGDWRVGAEPGTPSAPNALCQVATTTFPAIALGANTYRDVSVTTRFNAISGNDDQAAGIIGRVVDGDNYYILRANALEGNVNLYAYVGGSRRTLAEGQARVEAGRWHELRLDITGSTLTGFLDGQRWSPPPTTCSSADGSACGPRPTPKPASTTPQPRHGEASATSTVMIGGSAQKRQDFVGLRAEAAITMVPRAQPGRGGARGR